MSEEVNIKQLLREGIEAARADDKVTARAKFEQVTELDENNENAWLWLASVVDTDEEKRVCLSNVLVINPGNEKAQKMMDRLQEKKRQQAAEEEVIPGVSRRQLMLIGGGGAAVIIILIVLFVTSTISTNSANAAATQNAQRLFTEQTATVEGIALLNTSQAETQIAAVGTDTPTPRERQLEATWTPTPSETPPAAAQAIATPPPSIPGTIVLWGGRDSLSNGALSLYAVPANGSTAPAQIGTELGRDVRYVASGQRVVYTFYDSALFTFGLQSVNINGTQLQPINPRLPDALILNVEQPDYCATANRIVHIGIPEVQLDANNLQFNNDRPPTKLFITDLDGGSTIQITSDEATYTYPAFSPDCLKIAVVRDDKNSASPGADVVVIDIANGTQTPVTTDFGTFTETTPRWSNDGTQIFYAAAQATTPNNHDIAYVNADGTGTPLLPVRDEFDTVFPVISPDGQYIAYASNRTGDYQIFIQSLVDNTIWQLTNGNGDFYPGGWR